MVDELSYKKKKKKTIEGDRGELAKNLRQLSQISL